MSINDRIEKLIKHFGLSASAFADSIGIQRPSMSHILSGRNKASLDVVQKVLEAYPDVSSDWLISGNGAMIENVEKSAKPDKKDEIINVTNVNKEKQSVAEENSQISEVKKVTNEANQLAKSLIEEDIERIVVFYKNNTFKVYYNK